MKAQWIAILILTSALSNDLALAETLPGPSTLKAPPQTVSTLKTNPPIQEASTLEGIHRQLNDARLLQKADALHSLPDHRSSPSPQLDFGLGGQSSGERRLGGLSQPPADTLQKSSKGADFHNPLDRADAQNSRPRSQVVGPAGVPQSNQGLVTQDTEEGTVVNESHSADGRRSSYGVEYPWGAYESTQVQRNEDGSYREDSVVYGADGSVASIRETTGDSERGQTTTIHTPNGDGTWTHRQYGDHTNAPREWTSPNPSGSQTAEDSRASGNPRGWFNPLTGHGHNNSLQSTGNQVNPGRDGAATAAVGPTLQVDSQGLVAQPHPDEHSGQMAQPISPQRLRNGPTIVDPMPQPQD